MAATPVKRIPTLAESLAQRLREVGVRVLSVTDAEVEVAGNIILRLPGHGVSLACRDLPGGYHFFKTTDDCVAEFRKAARRVE